MRFCIVQCFKDGMHAYDHGVAMNILTAIIRYLHDFEIRLGIPKNTLVEKLTARMHNLCNTLDIRRKDYVRYVRIRTIRTQYVRDTYKNTYEYVRIRTNTYIFTPTGFRRAQPYFFRPCTYSYVLVYVFRTYLYILKTKRVRICMYCETIFSPTCPVQSD